MQPSIASLGGSLPIRTTPPPWPSLSVGAKTGTSGPNRGSEKAGPVGYGFLIWAIAGIVILALALLFLLLPISTARTYREPRPDIILGTLHAGSQIVAPGERFHPWRAFIETVGD